MKVEDNQKYNYCHIVGSTHQGRVRKANEDNMGNFETVNGLVSVVCDGMGGHVGGATASRIAIEAIRHFMDVEFYNDPREVIGEAIEAANRAILQEAARNPELTGMGSTCVLLLIRDAKVYCGHVGDSRIYLIRNHRIKQLTKDHSYVQMLVDMGHISSEEAEHHPRKNEITNALGIEGMRSATIMQDPISPEAGDCFLLCSDGLSGMVSDNEIEKIVSRQHEMGSQERADRLVQRANEYGGVDNITVQLVEFAVTPGTIQQKRIGKKTLYTGVLALLAVCVIAGGIYWFGPKAKATKIHSRESKVIDKPEITFQPEKLAVRIEYGTKGTKVYVGESPESIELAPLHKDSIKLETEGIGRVSRGNNTELWFTAEYVEKLCFQVADTATIYKFEIPVREPIATGFQDLFKGTQKGETPPVVNDKPTGLTTEKESNQSEGNGNNKPISSPLYDIRVKYEANKKIFKFALNQKYWQIEKEPKDIYVVQLDNFRVDEKKIGDINRANGSISVKKDGNSFDFYFTNEVPKDSLVYINIPGTIEGNAAVVHLKVEILKK